MKATREELIREIRTRIFYAFGGLLLAWPLLYVVVMPFWSYAPIWWSAALLIKFIFGLIVCAILAMILVLFVQWNEWITKEKDEKDVDDLL